MTTTALSTAALPSVDTGLSAYLRQIRQFPMLDPQNEYMLACRLRDHGDVDAAQTLVTSHLRLVAKIAMGYRRYGLPLADLIAEGNLGLMKAVRKFDPEKGFRLATYAMWWIKANINEFVLNSWSIVKIGSVSTQKRMFYNLRRLKAQLGAYEDGALSPDQVEQIATELDVKAKDVEAMNARLSARDSSLNALVGEDGSTQRLDLLADEAPTQEERLEAWQEETRSKALVREALAVLNPREQDIIRRRRLTHTPETLEALGEDYGLSRERVRQIEARAMEKLEGKLRELVSTEKRAVAVALEDHRLRRVAA